MPGGNFDFPYLKNDIHIHIHVYPDYQPQPYTLYPWHGVIPPPPGYVPMVAPLTIGSATYTTPVRNQWQITCSDGSDE